MDYDTDVNVTTKKEEGGPWDGDFTYSHPSYGLISVHRQQGGTVEPLFGSEVASNTKVAITIKRAKVTQRLGKNWYFERDLICKVLMSPVQYAEMISNPNTQGAPCTIDYTQDDGAIKYKPIDTQISYVESKIETEVSQLKTNVKQIQKDIEVILNQPGTLKKKDKQDIVGLVNKLTNKIRDSLPYYEKQLQESIVKLKSEAKTEIDAYVQHAISKAGVIALNNPEALKLMLEDKK